MSWLEMNISTKENKQDTTNIQEKFVYFIYTDMMQGASWRGITVKQNKYFGTFNFPSKQQLLQF